MSLPPLLNRIPSTLSVMCCLAILPALAGGTDEAAVDRTVDPQTGLTSWRWEAEEVSITFNQRLPDQSRAYFQGRGFPPPEAEKIADSCVFQAIIRNGPDAVGSLALDLGQWRVIPEGASPRPMQLEPQWQAEWVQQGVEQAARIAFRWSFFPVSQTFQPGDWNMGMVTVGLPAGHRFDLEVLWSRDGAPQRVRFEHMQCAPDRHI